MLAKAELLDWRTRYSLAVELACGAEPGCGVCGGDECCARGEALWRRAAAARGGGRWQQAA